MYSEFVDILDSDSVRQNYNLTLKDIWEEGVRVGTDNPSPIHSCLTFNPPSQIFYSTQIYVVGFSKIKIKGIETAHS
jgi:hypothetical protein